MWVAMAEAGEWAPKTLQMEPISGGLGSRSDVRAYARRPPS